MRTTLAAQNKDGVYHVDQDQDCRPRSRTLAVTGTIASTTTRHRPSRSHGASAPASSAPPIVGTAIAASNDGYYYDGYRRCGWVRQFDAYGNYIGRVRTCGY
jgi:hypothetical protein